MRDELILALDLYLQEGRVPTDESVRDLSKVLRAIPIDRHFADDPRFRNENGVRLKVSSFVAIDPASDTSGMSRHGAGDVAVWDEFHQRPDELHAAAMAIRSVIAENDGKAGELSSGDEVDEEAAEGALLTRRHRSRERNARIVAKKKEQALARDGRLACEACSFDFREAYGSRGEGFIECHHTVPLHSLAPGGRTRLSDLALVCSNCHRMIHRRKEWLTIAQLREILREKG